MKNDTCALLEQEVRGKVLRDESMAHHTSLKVGGAADWFIVPADLEDLQHLLKLLADQKIPWLVVGGGYNLLVRDGGFRGVVISLAGFSCLDIEGETRVRAGAGVENRQLATFCRDNSLAGLEFLVGIPGRLGGALAMNAGANGKSVTDSLAVLVTLKGGAVEVAAREDLEFGYRFLRLAPGEIILEAVFQLQRGAGREITSCMENFLFHRRTAQLVGYPNAGSFFKNPPAGPAWRFIDAAGMRGLQIGGAQVSEVHANFLVNRGGATAGDFLALADRIKEKVREMTGIVLEEEVRIVGED